jgi:hypothetical protein
MNLPGTPAWRRRAAFVFLGIGVALGAKTISRDLPHDQTLVFRLDERDRHAPLELHATFTRVGASEASAGVTITRDGSEPGDPRHTVRLPNGDYVVTIDWKCRTTATLRSSGDANAEPKEGETSRVERVSLLGGEIIVHLQKRADPQ